MIRESGLDPQELAGEMLTFFMPAFRPYRKGNLPVVPVREGGTTVWYEFDANLYSSLAGLDAVQVHKVIDWLFVKPANVLRAGTTGLSAGFSFLDQPDAGSADVPGA